MNMKCAMCGRAINKNSRYFRDLDDTGKYYHRACKQGPRANPGQCLSGRGGYVPVYFIGREVFAFTDSDYRILVLEDDTYSPDALVRSHIPDYLGSVAACVRLNSDQMEKLKGDIRYVRKKDYGKLPEIIDGTGA